MSFDAGSALCRWTNIIITGMKQQGKPHWLLHFPQSYKFLKKYHFQLPEMALTMVVACNLWCYPKMEKTGHPQQLQNILRRKKSWTDGGTMKSSCMGLFLITPRKKTHCCLCISVTSTTRRWAAVVGVVSHLLSPGSAKREILHRRPPFVRFIMGPLGIICMVPAK